MTAPLVRAFGWAVAVGVGLLLAAWGTAVVVASWRYQSGLERVRRLVASGRFAEARPWLAAWATGAADAAEVAYFLGVCEHAAGRPAASLEAWERVPLASPFGVRAALARAQTLVGDFGRFAAAEPLLESARRGTGPEARVALY